jgi:chorismate synthase
MGDISDGDPQGGSSIGAVIEVVAEGRAAGLGAPIYGKLDADIAAALMSINAVKGVEIGDGFAAAALRGEDNADEMRMAATAAVFPVQPCRRHSGRHLHRPAGRRALRGQADQLDPDPRRSVDRTGARPRSSPKAATTPASASAPCRWARR